MTLDAHVSRSDSFHTSGNISKQDFLKISFNQTDLENPFGRMILHGGIIH